MRWEEIVKEKDNCKNENEKGWKKKQRKMRVRWVKREDREIRDKIKSGREKNCRKKRV